MTSKGEEVFRVMTMSWNETVVVGWLGLRNSVNLLKALECMLEAREVYGMGIIPQGSRLSQRPQQLPSKAFPQPPTPPPHPWG